MNATTRLKNADNTKAKKLAELKPRYIQVSMDGNKKIHDAIRGKGNFVQTLEAIDLLTANNIKVMVSFTANKLNFRCFPEVANICRKHDVDFLWSDRLIPEGNAEKLNNLLVTKDTLMTQEDTHEFFNIMKIEADNCIADKTTKTRVKMHRALQFQYSNTTPYRCVAGETLITIMPNGDLFPCRRMPVTVGNVFKTPLASLYFNSPFLRNLRNQTKVSKGCEGCKSQEDCRGGLKCLSYAVHGDAHIKDPGCSYKAILPAN